jgi:peptidoglycan/xylan/chitin deacetylase (PgdA/CDA1 family)
MMLKFLKNTIEFTSALLYWAFLAAVRKKPHRIVIYYHSLKKEDIVTFEKQMAYLANNCNVVKASEIAIAPTNSSNTTVAITFDDALISFLDNALPVLQKYKLPAAVFVPTGNMGSHPNWTLEDDCDCADEKVMSEKDVAGLSQVGCEVFSHTVSHPHLNEIDLSKLRNELEQSKQTLEQIMGHNICAISYPYGAYDTRVCNLAKQLGYELGFTIEPYSIDSSPNNLEIGRLKVSASDGMLKFRLKIMGAYQVLSYLRAAKRMLTRQS